jgi:SPP1 gp7 family putative phage head morphogenesis protein
MLKRLMQHALRNKTKLKRFPRMRPPDEIERAYLRELLPILETVQHMAKKKIIPRLPGFAEDFYKNRPLIDHGKRKDAASDDIMELIKGLGLQLQESYSEDELRTIATKIGMEVSDYNMDLLRQGLKKVATIDLFFPDTYLGEELAAFAASNVELITNLGEEALDRIQKEIFDGFRQGLRWEDIAENILDVSDPEDGITRRRADFIARDQVSKLNANLNQLRQMDLGLERYTWRTCLDERVRDSHAEKEGKVFRFDDPPDDTGNPGEDYGCRCWAEPLMEDLLDEQPAADDEQLD